MKTSLTVSASILTLFLVGGVVAQSNKGENTGINHADCLSQEDVNWHTDLSKSGIARTCTNSILQHNLQQLNSL
ncbi:hypothetical protein ACLKMH_21790 [Psychromonas sp. KJ10-10]|uniref:hypothetical protein n=1 Tax=Psychromonas sp. KJ10-10 TaxID=3391823 RepID=UPI0039B434A9